MSRNRPARIAIVLMVAFIVLVAAGGSTFYALNRGGHADPTPVSEGGPPKTVSVPVKPPLMQDSAIPARSTGNALLDVVLKPAGQSSGSIVDSQLPLQLDLKTPPPPIPTEPTPSQP